MKDDVKRYPVSEIFTSIQGEGVYAGQVQTFIRLAGCSVGKKISFDEKEQVWQKNQPSFGHKPDNKILAIQSYTEVCTLWDDRTFLCDTDFQTKEVLTAGEIIERIPKNIHHVCLTGGEPLMHDLSPLFDVFWYSNEVIEKVHIETSGTIHINKIKSYDQLDSFDFIWLTVAPKKGVLPQMLAKANEIKILVDEKFDFEKFKQWAYDTGILANEHIFFQPVNNEHTINLENLERVKKLVMENPQFKVSLQNHKILNVR